MLRNPDVNQTLFNLISYFSHNSSLRPEFGIYVVSSLSVIHSVIDTKGLCSAASLGCVNTFTSMLLFAQL